ncbi:MAG: ArsR family transcriptional regulator [Spirochaetaceae bacterium]|nr:MAG: ArsR family transcriptional regulator [Spirochaetaceae bacterium]
MRIYASTTISRLKALADPTRLRIVNLLAVRPLCVCSIEQVLGVSQTAASRHLARLQAAGILDSERRAQWVYYSLDEGFVTDHAGLLDYLKGEAADDVQLREDGARLEQHVEADTLCAADPEASTPDTVSVLSLETTRTKRNTQKEYV